MAVASPHPYLPSRRVPRPVPRLCGLTFEPPGSHQPGECGGQDGFPVPHSPGEGRSGDRRAKATLPTRAGRPDTDCPLPAWGTLRALLGRAGSERTRPAASQSLAVARGCSGATGSSGGPSPAQGPQVQRGHPPPRGRCPAAGLPPPRKPGGKKGHLPGAPGLHAEERRGPKSLLQKSRV